MNSNDNLYQNCFLASYALFKVMYDKEQSLPIVISKFIKNVIISKKLRCFSEFDIKTHLKKEYDFDLPIAIIKTSLKKINDISYSSNIGYKMTIMPNADKAFSEQLYKLESDRVFLIGALFDYIEKENTRVLTENEKGSIVSSLQKFLLAENAGTLFNKEISSFIIKNQSNEKINSILEEIKKGIILYSGLTYNEKPNDFGSFANELTIFLDLEILFDCLGYNGELYEHLFFDFHKLVSEINEKTLKKNGKKDIIKLRYFNDVEKNFISFFKTAESIIRGDIEMDPSTSAMPKIINGCESPSDVIEKMAKAKEFLEKLQIFSMEDEHYYDNNNHKYNQESQELFEAYKNKFIKEKESSIAEKIKFVNYIVISRRNKYPKDFENAKFILLTDKGLTLSIAKELKENGEVPLSMSMEYLTSKLWFKLNKGFSLTSFPSSFKVITKAQIIISNEISNFVSEKYQKLKADKNLNKDEAVSRYHELLKSMRYPEEINAESIDDIEKNIISFSDVTVYANSLDKLTEELSHKTSDLEVKDKKIYDFQRALLEKEEEIKNISESLKSKDFENMQLKIELEKRKKDEALNNLKNEETKYNERLKEYVDKKIKEHIFKASFKYIFCLILLFFYVTIQRIIPLTLTYKNIILGVVLFMSYFFIPATKRQIKKLFLLIFSKKYRQDKLKLTKNKYVKEFKTKEPPPTFKQ